MQPLRRLPPFKRFKALGMEMNKIIDRANALILRGGPSCNVRYTSTGTVVEIPIQRKRSARVRQFRLKSASNADFFVCRELTVNADWNPDTDEDRFIEGDEDIYIAKPYLLRRSEFDGLTLTVPVETRAGATAVTTNRFFSYQYLSATLRIKRELDAGGNIIGTPEDQRVTPPFVADDDIIYAVQQDDLQMEAFGKDVTLVSIADGRAWAKI